MSQIAVKLKDNHVDDVVFSNPKDYETEEDYILIENDPSFSINDRFMWTIRFEDNKLVHISSNQTSEEEKNAVITNLTLQNLQQANEITELKEFSSSQTIQSLQDAQDKENLQKVATSQAMQILELQKSVSDIKSGTTTN